MRAAAYSKVDSLFRKGSSTQERSPIVAIWGELRPTSVTEEAIGSVYCIAAIFVRVSIFALGYRY